jgi:hypothetical protein
LAAFVTLQTKRRMARTSDSGMSTSQQMVLSRRQSAFTFRLYFKIENIR